jgi:mutator protein MutT
LKKTVKKPLTPKQSEAGSASRPKLTREVSAMAWIENHFGQVLMVRQAQGSKVWTLPGGKVRGTEELAQTLQREVREEIGIAVSTAQLAAIYDRSTRQNLTVLFLVRLKTGDLKIERPQEIAEIAFKARLPANASPSARFFWKHHQKIPSFRL